MSTNVGQGPREGSGPATAAPAPEIRGYQVVRLIGRGGMGAVYLARQANLGGRPVAVKFWAPVEGPGGDPQADLARFRREAELMARVAHPFVLPVFDFGEAQGRPYLVMEYGEGGDLRGLMTLGQPLALPRTRALLRSVGEALACLHRHGIIHRDLKPENILLTGDGLTPKVSDFGVAAFREADGARAQTGRGVGTLGYVAPEQQYRLKVDERADQYSLAALAYELLTGQLPLGVFKPPSQLNRRLGPGVDAVILRGLRESPKDRYPTVVDFTDALDRALAGSPGRPVVRGLAWGAVASLTLALGLVWWLQVQWSRPTPLRAGPKAPGPLTERPPTVPPVPTPPEQHPEPGPAGGDPIKEELKRLVARQIWEEQGRPEGAKGEACREANWFKAAERVEDRLNKLAYEIWESEGKPRGDVARDRNWRAAERRMYKSLTGHDFAESSSPARHGNASAP